MRYAFFFVLFFFLMVNGIEWTSFSQDIKAENIPIHLTSDRLVIDEKKSIIVFEGRVVVNRDDVTIMGDKLSIYGKPGEAIKSDKPIGEQIDRIEIEGNVKIVQGDRVALSNKAIYYVSSQKILLTGNPVVSQGQDRLSGQMITIYLKERKSVVEGGKEKPVEVILTPSSESIKGMRRDGT